MATDSCAQKHIARMADTDRFGVGAGVFGTDMRTSFRSMAGPIRLVVGGGSPGAKRVKLSYRIQTITSGTESLYTRRGNEGEWGRNGGEMGDGLNAAIFLPTCPEAVPASLPTS